MQNKRPFPRHVRVSAQLQREIAEWLILNAEQPYNTAITITRLDMQKNFSHATVYVLPQNSDDAEEIQAMLDYLETIRHDLQHHLGRNLRMKRTPRLHFEFDRQYSHAAKMEEVFLTLDEHEQGAANE